jgi:hypothetical protein
VSKDGVSASQYALVANAQSFEIVGITDITIEATDLELKVNRTGGAITQNIDFLTPSDLSG